MKNKQKILLFVSIAFSLLTIIAPILTLIFKNLRLAADRGVILILIWVIVWITILRLSRNYKIPKKQNRLLTFLVIASSIAFTAFILYGLK